MSNLNSSKRAPRQPQQSRIGMDTPTAYNSVESSLNEKEINVGRRVGPKMLSLG